MELPAPTRGAVRLAVARKYGEAGQRKGNGMELKVLEHFYLFGRLKSFDLPCAKILCDASELKKGSGTAKISEKMCN
jgi:hypothetical protein